MRRAVLALAAAVPATLVLAAPAWATTETFNFTGAAQTWTVPAGVTAATFDLYGAQGDGFADDPVFGPGLGGRATATIAVTPGDSIQVNVGGQAPPGGLGGFNGGGFGGVDGAFGGGGASDIRIDDLSPPIGDFSPDDRVLVAGGGGGAGLDTCDSQPVSGGDGGGVSGDPGLAGPCLGAVAGGGGTQTDGGSAMFPAGEGDFDFGGNASGPGGGGGGGWYGGGGGLGAAGGGGGSGHGPEGRVFQTGVREGDGLVTVTYNQTCFGHAPTIFALSGQPIPSTDGRDVIIGTQGADVIDAGAGNDVVCAGDGADQVNGGEGADLLHGRRGADTVAGEAGADLLYGGNGADALSGGEGDDKAYGRAGNDSLDGNAGFNTLDGAEGNDACINGPVLIRCNP